MKHFIYILLITIAINPLLAQEKISLEGLSKKEIRDLILNQEDNPEAAQLMLMSKKKKTAASVLALTGLMITTAAVIRANQIDARPGSLDGLDVAFWTMTGLTVGLVGVGFDASGYKKYRQAKSLYEGNISDGEKNILVNMTSTGKNSNRQLRDFLLKQDQSETARTLASKYSQLKNISSFFLFTSITGFIASSSSKSGRSISIGSGLVFASCLAIDRKSKRLLNEAKKVYLGEESAASVKDIFIRDDRMELPSYTIVK